LLQATLLIHQQNVNLIGRLAIIAIWTRPTFKRDDPDVSSSRKTQSSRFCRKHTQRVRSRIYLAYFRHRRKSEPFDLSQESHISTLPVVAVTSLAQATKPSKHIERLPLPSQAEEDARQRFSPRGRNIRGRNIRSIPRKLSKALSLSRTMLYSQTSFCT
jgi:hypothetical protein